MESNESTGVQEPRNESCIDIEQERAYRNADVLHRLYHTESLSLHDMADKLDCDAETIRRWMKHHDIERRDRAEAMRGANRKERATVIINKYGYEIAAAYSRQRESVEKVRIHRLIAVAQHGFEAVVGMDVHHDNGIKWDNRPGNLEVLSPEKHLEIHAERGDFQRPRNDKGEFVSPEAEVVE